MSSYYSRDLMNMYYVNEWMVIVVGETDKWQFLMFFPGLEFLCQNSDFVGNLKI